MSGPKTLVRKPVRRTGKSPSTQAGKYVRKEIEHTHVGKHGAQSVKQVRATGLSKAHRAGVSLNAPANAKMSDKARRSAILAYIKKQSHTSVAKRASVAHTASLKRAPAHAASHTALSHHAHATALTRSPIARSTAAKKAALTKSATERSVAAKKAAMTRAHNKTPSMQSRWR